MSLYPDVDTAGSLAALLRALGVAAAVDERDPMYRATLPTPVPYRNDLEVSAIRHERRWSVVGGESHQHLPLVAGYTADPLDIAAVATAWHDGVALPELCELAPWLQPTGRFEVPSGDPVALGLSEWQSVLAEMSEPGLYRLRAITQAAYASPELRGLYPYTSHWVLKFSTTTRPFLHDVGLSLWAEADDAYVVRSRYLGDVIGSATTPDDAVAIAVRQLPPDLGPVTSGQ
ncbi:DUF6193 family natural product biosynthesis protein [Dactylosporangium sp. CS-047395]|uniref:DUF6193 family natural product biosynthesis protein n=1 Tax=Dactylosporangium sp. CS-047395 TaxID=3239936 RepID=UPI003D93FD57